MENILLLVVQVVSALLLIGLILIQQGKGADAGASFGGGASQTVFGSSGSGNFLTRMTAILATVFFVTSLLLAYVSKKQMEVPDSISVLEELASPTELPALDIETAETGDLPLVDEAELPLEPVAESSSAEEWVDGAPEEVRESLIDSNPSAVSLDDAVDSGLEKMDNSTPK